MSGSRAVIVACSDETTLTRIEHLNVVTCIKRLLSANDTPFFIHSHHSSFDPKIDHSAFVRLPCLMREPYLVLL